MNEKFIRTGIGSHRHREKQAVNAALHAIEEGLYAHAANCLVEAQGHREAIEELEYIIEAMEVENDDR